ncbi:hypothetical protein FH608_049995 [Nonomuraea phyllanthi]|uniref:PucR C-terminal helix-turn-helix domain-containing protein n=1 Tax=Nonomuraea phyllanthi TaxID=2219224 RepID=A0A5C4UUL1_9ACTN|nr:hypothetical protein FH608_049995 [Nonomuraea phyllanthi]
MTEAVALASGVRPRQLVAVYRDVIVAVSDPAQRDLLNAYRTARGALTVAGHAGRSGSTITLDDLGVAGLLLQLGDPVRLRAYADRTLGTLIRYDRDHGAALLRTLRTYLDSGMDRHRAARALTLHPNTVSQRLRRIEALTGLDLRSSQAVIDAGAALIVLDVAEGTDAARDPGVRPVAYTSGSCTGHIGPESPAKPPRAGARGGASGPRVDGSRTSWSWLRVPAGSPRRRSRPRARGAGLGRERPVPVA